MGPLLATLLAAAAAATPPSLVVAPAGDPAVLDARRVPLVVRWAGSEATVQARRGDRWRTLGEDRSSPFTTPRLPPDTELRLVRDGTPGEPARARRVWTPADIAAWSGPGLPGARVVDLEETGQRLWAATLEGGLASWDGRAWRSLHRRHGLPGDRVIEIDTANGGAWVATDGGLARVVPDAVERTWTAADGLPDSYVQAVHAAGDTVWAGTYRGLARVRGDDVRTVLSPWSCFSLIHGPDQRVWVGYEGLRGLPDGEPIEGVDPDLRVFDAAPRRKGVWLAALEQGLLWLEDGLTEPRFRPAHGDVVAIADLGDDVIVAAAQDGVWRQAGGAWVHHGVAQGLPDPVANTVAPGPRSKVWVGTDRGVALLDPAGRATALPLAPLPAGVTVHGIEAGRRGWAVASDEGLRWLGRRRPRHWGDLVAAAGPGVRAVRRIGRDWWALTGSTAFRLDRRGRLHRWDLPAEGVGIAPSNQGVALATVQGVHWWVPGASQRSALEPAPDLRALHAGRDGGLWIATEQALLRRGLDRTRSWHAVPGPRDVATGVDGAWVASSGGLYLVDGDGEVHPASSGWSAGPLVAVAAAPGAVWAAGEDGRVWGPDPRHPEEFDLDAGGEAVDVLDLVADEHGVWVATDRGLYRIRR